MKKSVFILLLILLIPAVYADEPDFSYLKANFLNQDPDPAVPGDYVDLRWKIEKLGNSVAQDVRFRLDADYPFSLDRTDTAVKSIGNWAGYSEEDEYYILRYKVFVDDDAREGTYKTKLSVLADGGISSGLLGEYDVVVAEKKVPVLVLGSLVSDPVKLVPDIDEAKLEVQIENIGDGNAENVVAELILPKGVDSSYSYSDRANLGTIESDGSDTATFYVDISGDVKGLLDSSLRLTYQEEDDNEIRTLELPLDIPLKDKPTFEISGIETIPEEVSPGGRVKIRMDLKNIGGKKAESVSIRAFKDSSQPFSFDEKTDYIGNLEPGDSGEAVIILDVDKDAVPKKYQLDLEVRTIFESDVLVEEEPIYIKVDGGKGSSSPIIGIALVIVIAGIAVAGYLLTRKKK